MPIKEGGTPMLAKQKWQIATINVLEQVFEERLRQYAQYGANDDLEPGVGPNAQWLAQTSHALHTLDATAIEEAFREEYEAYKANAPNGLPTWMHLVREEVAEAFKEEPNSDAFIHEILQVAALCCSWVEAIYRARAAGHDLL